MDKWTCTVLTISQLACMFSAAFGWTGWCDICAVWDVPDIVVRWWTGRWTVLIWFDYINISLKFQTTRSSDTLIDCGLWLARLLFLSQLIKRFWDIVTSALYASFWLIDWFLVWFSSSSCWFRETIEWNRSRNLYLGPAICKCTSENIIASWQ